MDYSPHLRRIIERFGVLEGYTDATDFEKCIVLMHKNNCTYTQIQQQLGNPAKKQIREVLIKYHLTPGQEVKKSKPKNLTELRLIGLCRKFNKYEFDLTEFNETTFYVLENTLYFDCKDHLNGFLKSPEVFTQWDERTQKSILYEVSRIFNIDIKTTEYE